MKFSDLIIIFKTTANIVRIDGEACKVFIFYFYIGNVTFLQKLETKQSTIKIFKHFL